MDDGTAWMLWAPPLWPDSVSTIHFCSTAASPATATLGNSLSSMKYLLHLTQAMTLGYRPGKTAQACFCDRPHVIAAAIAAATD